MSTRLAARHLILTALALGAPQLAAAQEACTTYTVRDGDSLGSIAQAAYGSFNYQMIFNANRDVIANNPGTLPAGLQLVLPCEDGRLTADTELSSVIASEDQKQEATATKSSVYERPLRFVTGSGWKPFTDESLTEGGILVRLAMTALQRGGNNRDSSVSWVDDWGSHTDVLLPSKAFDISIAWSMPDCSKLDLLGPGSVTRCQEFDASLPVYEVADSMTTLIDSPYAGAKEYSDLAGARVCKPADWSSHPLEEVGLVEPVVTHVRPRTPLDCGEALLNGEADVMAIELETATDVFTQLDALDQVAINPTLVRFLTYHFITSKSNPRGREFIAALNVGIEEMRESGEWYDIVATGLAEYNGMTN